MSTDSLGFSPHVKRHTLAPIESDSLVDGNTEHNQHMKSEKPSTLNDLNLHNVIDQNSLLLKDGTPKDNEKNLSKVNHISVSQYFCNDSKRFDANEVFDCESTIVDFSQTDLVKTTSEMNNQLLTNISSNNELSHTNKRSNIHTPRSNSSLGYLSSNTLSITRRFIKCIDKNLFRSLNLSNVKTLRITNNHVMTISDDVFDLFPNLKILDLKFNHLKSMPDNLFVKCPQLEELHIQKNFIGKLSLNIGLASNLQILDCSNNSLTSVEALPDSLIILDLSNNKIEDFPSCICNLPKLQKLNTDYNNFSNIPTNFYMLRSLNDLHFSWFKYCTPPIVTRLKTPESTNYLEEILLFCKQKSDEGRLFVSLVDILKRFSNHEYFVEEVFPNGMTRLHYATLEDDVGYMKSLIEKGIDIDSTNELGFSSLLLAVREGKSKAVEYLCKAKAQVNYGGGILGSSLHVATVNLDMNCVKILLEANADVNFQDADGNTPMHVLMSVYDKMPLKAYNIAMMYAKRLCNLNQYNKNFWAPVHLAARRGQFEGIKFMIKYNFEAPILCQNRSCEHYVPNKIDCVDKQYECSKSISSYIKVPTCIFDLSCPGGLNYWSPLHLAAYSNHIFIVIKLIETGLNVLIRNKDGMTARHIASKHVIMSKILYAAESRMKFILTHPEYREEVVHDSVKNLKSKELSDYTPDYSQFQLELKSLESNPKPLNTRQEVLIDNKNERKKSNSCGLKVSSISKSDSISTEDSAKFEMIKFHAFRVFTKFIFEFRVLESVPCCNDNKLEGESYELSLDFLKRMAITCSEAFPMYFISKFTSIINFEKNCGDVVVDTFASMIQQGAYSIESLNYVKSFLFKFYPSVSSSESLLHYALRQRCIELLNLLLIRYLDKHFLEKSKYEKSTILHSLACGTCKYIKFERSKSFNTILPTILFLFDIKQCIDELDSFGETPLHIAVRRGDYKLAQILLINGANPNASSAYLNKTPLHIAVENGHYSLLLLLLYHPQIDVNMVDKELMTPLNRAIMCMDIRAASILLNSHAKSFHPHLSNLYNWARADGPYMHRKYFSDMKSHHLLDLYKSWLSSEFSYENLTKYSLESQQTNWNYCLECLNKLKPLEDLQCQCDMCGIVHCSQCSKLTYIKGCLLSENFKLNHPETQSSETPPLPNEIPVNPNQISLIDPKMLTLSLDKYKESNKNARNLWNSLNGMKKCFYGWHKKDWTFVFGLSKLPTLIEPNQKTPKCKIDTTEFKSVKLCSICIQFCESLPQL